MRTARRSVAIRALVHYEQMNRDVFVENKEKKRKGREKKKNGMKKNKEEERQCMYSSLIRSLAHRGIFVANCQLLGAFGWEKLRGFCLFVCLLGFFVVVFVFPIVLLPNRAEESFFQLL